MSNLIGQTIGQYQVVEQLGRGGMATVFKAFQPSMERYVALKILPEQFAKDSTFVERFRREAKAIAQLEHPHILPVFDYGEHDGLTYMVMRCLESGTLATRLKQSIDVTEVVRFLIQVAEALDYTHRRGIIHRDIKPSNILIDPHGQALLTDFGIAKAVEGVQGLTAGGIIGTPEYMSPEQAQSQPVDGRSDLYALGVILYQAVVGHPPFEAETPVAVLMKHVSEPLPVPRRINPAVSQAMEQVILKALAKDPADRFQTAREMAEAMQAALSDSGQTAAATQISATPTPTPPLPATAGPSKSSQSRQWPIVIVVSVALLLTCGLFVVGGGTYWWLNGDASVSGEAEMAADVVETVVVAEESEATDKNTPATVVITTPVDTASPTETSLPTEPPPEEAPVKVEPTESKEAEPVSSQGSIEVKGGSSFGQATEISMGTYTGFLAKGEEHWYKFEIPPEQIFNLSFTPGEDTVSWMDAWFYNSGQSSLWSVLDVRPMVTKSVSKLFGSNAGGMHYLWVAGSQGSYTIELWAESQNEGGVARDAGDESDQALEVQSGTSFKGQVGDLDQEDWYQVNIPDGHIFNLVFTPTPGQDVTGLLGIKLLSQDRGEVWRGYNLGPPDSASVTRIMGSNSGGIYFIQIYPQSGKATYMFELSLQSQNDADSGGDAANEAVEALEMGLPGNEISFSGQIGDFDKVDWYEVDVPNGHILNLAFTAAGENTEEQAVTIYNPGQQKIYEAWNIGPSMTAEMGIVMNNASGGSYYVVAGGGKGDYTIDLSTQSQNDADSGGDAADELVEALEVKTGQAFTGQIGHFDQEDWYQFRPKAGQVINFTPGKDTEKTISVQLYDPEQKRIWNEGSVKLMLTKSFELSEPAEGAYYVKVAAEDYGSYTLEIK